MFELVTLNSFLNAAQNNVTSAQLKIDEKKEELRKLEKALTNLGQKKSDFIDEKNICSKPKLTLKTLNGDNGEEVTDYRLETLEVHFLFIPENQISEAEEEIESKIKEVEAEIKSLGATITSEKTRITSLSNQKRVVINKS